MALYSVYGVLKGRVTGWEEERGERNPHFTIRLHDGHRNYRAPVNVRSRSDPPELLYLAKDPFRHPLVESLADLPSGFTKLRSAPDGLALDYLRSNLFHPSEMRVLPHDLPGRNDDLSDRLVSYTRQARDDPGATLCVFGAAFPNARHVEGVHDIHMNQGNARTHRRDYTEDDGVYQDGGLIFRYSEDTWVGVFLAFRSQCRHTDDATGHCLPVRRHLENESEAPPLLSEEPLIAERLGAVRIIAAQVNPYGSDEDGETVLLLNATRERIVLDGWALRDRAKSEMRLQGVIEPGQVRAYPVLPPLQLPNKGGILTLLDPAGLKVDGVAYTRDDARVEGRMVLFGSV